MGAITGASLIDELQQRLDDASAVAYPATNLLDILNRVQTAVNIRLGLVHKEGTLTTGNTALYDAATFASDFAYVVQAFDDNKRELDLIPFSHLPMQSGTWLRDVAEKPDFVSQFGREIIVVTPIPRRAASVTIRYVKHPTAITDSATAWDLPDEHKPLVLDLAEAVLLFRGRYFKAMQEALQRVVGKLGLEDAAQIIRRGGTGSALPPTPAP